MLRLTLAECESYGIAVDNAKSWARPFSARFIEPGLVSYKDKGQGVSLLRQETIARHAQTFVGRPVVCTMQNGKLVHQRTSPENMKEVGHGYVTEVFFNSADGWWWAKGVVDTEEAAKAIREVGRVSCSYTGATVAKKGERNSVPYDNEITEMSGTHLAIVTNPRYEEAKIFLNSKESPTHPKNMNLLKLFWKKPAAAAADTTKTGADLAAQKLIENGLIDVSPDTKITVVDNAGKTEEVTIGQLVEFYNGRGAISPESEIEIAGEKVTIASLIETRTSVTKLIEEKKALTTERENAKGAADKAEADRKAKEKADADAAAKLTRDNAKQPDHFRLVMTAAARPATAATGERPNLGSLDEGVELGKKMFGTAAKA